MRLLFSNGNITANQGVGKHRRVAFVRQLLTSAILLTQVQLVWLTGAHYHRALSISRYSATTIAGGPAQGAPSDDGRSCPFCQLVRHNTSAVAASCVVHSGSLSSAGITPLILAAPPAASYLRLPGRDPP